METKLEIVKAGINSTLRTIELKWSDDCGLHYPFLWLRDNCRCEDCFHPQLLRRSSLIRTLDPQIEPVKVEIQQAGRQLNVTWPDGHDGDYTTDWLYKRGFRKESPVQNMEPLDKIPLKYWGKEILGKVPTLQFDKIMTDDSALYQWLVHVEETGLFLIQDAPKEAGQLHKLASRVSRLFHNCYGTTFHVKTTSGPLKRFANSTGAINMHTDLSTLEEPPGVQLFHCINQAGTGGESILADCLSVARRMRKDFPNMYKLLTTLPVFHSDKGAEGFEFFMASKYPVIELDFDGEPYRTHWNELFRESRQNHLPLELVQTFYEALSKFAGFMMDPEYCIEFKLKPGDVLCTQNNRVLHGRNAFTLQEGDMRYLEVGYLSWNDVRSKRRLLQTQMVKS